MEIAVAVVVDTVHQDPCPNQYEDSMRGPHITPVAFGQFRDQSINLTSCSSEANETSPPARRGAIPSNEAISLAQSKQTNRTDGGAE
jgi:hypothetical protein